MRPAAIAAILLSVAVGGIAHAAPQFTADAVEIEPGRDMRYVRLYFGEKGSRYEFRVSGQPVVQIVKPREGIALTLFPLSRTYLESRNAPNAPVGFRPSVACQPSPIVECRMEADTPAEGAGAQKIERWTIISRGEPVGVRLWWDTQRKIAVREEYPDGRVMQASMLGTLTFDNRTVENWEFLYLSPSGSYQRRTSLFSPELGFAVAEKQPGGASRELRNVQLGEPDAKLFEAPEGYQKVDVAVPPQGVSPGRGAEAAAPASAAPMPASQPSAPMGQTGPMTMPQPQALQHPTAPAPSNTPPPFPPYGWQMGPSPQAPRP